jgi:hypothetical protein
MSSATDDLLNLPPFGVAAETKAAVFLAAVREAIGHHYADCPSYARWCGQQGFDPSRRIESVADVPFLPVGIFKRLFLASVPEAQIVRVLASSGTSGQVPSRIPLDQTTRNRQMKALGAILSHRLGGQRRPFLILDAPPSSSSANDRELSARVAGMRGYLIAATEQEYALRREGDCLVLDRNKVLETIARWTAAGKPFCLLGYTYQLYEHVIRPLAEEGARIELPPSTFVLHFGGWKKLRQQAVSKDVLNQHAAAVFGLPPCAIVDIYGFTEQLGVVYPDDPQGLKRAPTYSEILVRDPRSLEIVPDGDVGLLEFVCPLPHSYPGVAVLLDDMGRIVSREPGSDSWHGTAFEIVGRAEKAEVRGCGDTLPG